MSAIATKRGRPNTVPNRTARDGYHDEWLTPPSIIEALGPFDLDPCASTVRPWPVAAHHFTIEDDGLAQDWSPFALPFVNPPYSSPWTWIERLACHGDGIALIFARTETAAFFQSVWGRASAMLFVRGRLRHYYPDGTQSKKNGGAPSVLVGYGEESARRLEDAEASGKIAGQLVRLGPSGVVAMRRARQPRLPLAASRRRRGLRLVG